jgi:hypothetical protein
MFAAVLAAALVLLGVPSTTQAAVAVSISAFHEQLTPFGRWVVAGSFGNVWVPNVAVGWAPYTDGQWIYTDFGWTWVSNDPWGGIPCHYGSWAWVDGFGWAWTPGTVWAPAWVTWAFTDDFVGWAPIPPTFVLSVTGFVGPPVVLATARYVFVPTGQFVGVSVASVRVPVAQNGAIFSRAVKNTNFGVSGGVVRSAGPSTAQIERASGRRIAPESIDRVRTRPTTIEQAGVRSGSRVTVAAPAAERERVAAGKSEAQPKSAATRGTAAKSEKAAPKTAAGTEKSRAETAPKAAAAKPAPSHPARPTEEKTTAAEHHAAKPPAQPKAKPAPEQHEAKKGAPKPAPKPAPKKEPQAEPPTQNRTEEHVASHEVRHAPAPAHPQKAAPKPKPQPEHQQPPKEEKPQ